MEENTAPQPFQFRDRRQQDIHRRLAIVGPGAAAFYLDACRMMAADLPFESSTHMVAHLLREIESAMRDVLVPVAERLGGELQLKKDASGDETHREEVLAILRGLEIPESDPVAQAWLKLPGTKNAYGLAARAHRDDLAAPRAVDSAFIGFWDTMNAILDDVLRRFEARYLTSHQVVDDLLAKSPPTRADAKTLRQHIPNNLVALGYFFDNNHDPTWLDPLSDESFFAAPPPPIREGQYAQLPPWPASRYLTRMAALAPDAVLHVIKEIPPTENVRVCEDLVDAALALPSDLAVELAPQAKQWAESHYPSLLPEKLGKLVAYLARDGYADAALDLARTLLAVLPDPLREEKKEHRFPLEPRARFDAREYGEVLKDNIPDLVKAGGLRTLGMLCDLLEEALKLRFEGYEGPVDYTYISRPAIEDHPQNRPHGIGNVIDPLITGVRDAAEQIVRSGLGTVEEVVALLEGHRWHVFQRLALHLIRVFAPMSPLAAECLTDRALFEAPSVHHEYVLLAQAGFAPLTGEEQEGVLQWGDQGPDIEQFQARYEKDTGAAPTDDVIQQYVNGWRSHAFSLFRTEVPSELVGQHSWLNDLERGETDEFESVTKSWIGPTSPLGTAQLHEMSPDEIVVYLNDWEPTGEFMSDSREGLARMLATEVAANPERFAERADIFSDVDAVYVAGLCEGWENAAKQKRSFAWEPVLNLCARAVASSTGEGLSIAAFGRDVSSWVRVTMARLLETGFSATSGIAEIPYELRELAWSVLEPLTNDSDPTSDTEEEHGVNHSKRTSTSWDPASLAINTVRGISMHAVIQYALWVKRHLDAAAVHLPPRAKASFVEMPEVERMLDYHLDPEQDSSLAIRSVYGQLFPWLVHVSPDWARRNVGRVFPHAQEQRALRDAAWNAYLRFCPPYSDVFEVLGDEYTYAVEHLGESDDSDVEGPHARLAEHLMALYWRGVLSLDEGSMLARFFARASDGVRGHALEFIGFSLRRAHDDHATVEPEVLQRLQALWDQRLSVAAHAEAITAYTQELAAFGDWFGSKLFDDAWAVKQLTAVLQRVGSVQSSPLVMGRLADLALHMPLQAVECLRLMIEGDKRGWEISIWRESLETILTTALRSADAASKQAATEVIHLLGARGYRDIGKLLTDSDKA